MMSEDKIEVALTRMLFSNDPGMVADAAAIKCLKLVYTDRVDTAATDGVCLLANPKFIDSLDINQVMGLLVHEICHVRFGHTERFQDSGWLDHERANKSMDREINPLVASAGYSLPPGGCWPAGLGLQNGLTWEEYYQAEEQLNQEPPQDDSQSESEDESEGDSESDSESDSGSGDSESDSKSESESESGSPGDDSDESNPAEKTQADSEDDKGSGKGSGKGSAKIRSGCHSAGELAAEFAPEVLEGLDAESAKELAREIREAIEDVADDSKIVAPFINSQSDHEYGSEAGEDFFEAAELIIATDCEWREVVIDLIGTRVSSITTADWSRPNRRSHTTGVYRPARRKISGGYKLALVLDISGSCVEFFSAWQSLAREMVESIREITELEIIYHDTRVTGMDSWSRADGSEIIIGCKGGGGTCFVDAIAAAEELDVDGIILFTDSDGRFPERCSKPCVTVQPPGSCRATPFGKTIRIESM